MKWESIAVAVGLLSFFGMLTVMSYSEEKTKQYSIGYNTTVLSSILYREI